MDSEKLSIFDLMYEPYKITKPIKLIELFAGYGSQSFALDYIGANYTSHKIVEWAIPSIIAYADAHSNDTTDYSKDLTKQEIADYLFKLGVSADYNKPATLEQLSKYKEDKLRLIYNSIKRTNNLVDISRVKGEDLEVNDANYDYLMSYSFPCQDLSVAGKRAGMQDNSTRSGLLWEVERILTEQKQLEKQGKGKMCEILLMENVIQVHSEQDKQHFIKWINRLEELGYQSYWEDCIATEIGYPEPIPQSRNRCFMVSIYGDYVYNFPKPKTLKLRLKDLLEKNVDEKYYLSKKQIEDIKGWNAYQKPLEAMEQTDETGISPTLTTRSGAYAAGMVLVKEDIEPKVLGGIGEKDSNGGTQWKQQNRIYDDNVAISVTTSFNPYYIDKVSIPLKRGYSCEIKQEQEDTDQIDVIGNYSKSNYIQTSVVGKNGIAPTVTENHGQVTGIVVEDNLKEELCNKLIENNLVEEYDVIKHSFSSQILDGNKKCVEKSDGVMITLPTKADCIGVAVKDNSYLRIRKLTPRECFRLQGVKDNDIDKIMKHQSDASGYHLAGDSICCTVLQAIFKELM